jgi:nondiscriminating aspartyl-tRNA synthetase
MKSGSVELEATEIIVEQKAETLPFDMGVESLHLELPTLLDYRSLTIRHPKIAAIFTLQAEIVDAFRKIAEELGSTEVFVPTIVASSTEGGADVFSIDYYSHKAYLAQSPQLYKQMLVPMFERVHTIAHAYRAEPSVTTRHLSEVTQIDMELGFMEFDELLDTLEHVGTKMLQIASEKHKDILEMYGVSAPLIPAHIPRLTLKETQDIITKRTGRDLSKEQDLNPEDEIEICKWAKEEHASDFVTITHFPLKKKPFYTHVDPKNKELSLSYDLLFRGREVLSGSQRVNDYKELVNAIKSRGMNVSNFGMYLQAFQYGMPKEGGFSFGLERLTMQLLELGNIREAAVYPRDMERVDERFSKKEIKKKS